MITVLLSCQMTYLLKVATCAAGTHIAGNHC